MSIFKKFFSRKKQEVKPLITDNKNDVENIEVKIEGSLKLFEEEEKQILESAMQLVDMGKANDLVDGIIIIGVICRGLKFKEIKTTFDGKKIIIFNEIVEEKINENKLKKKIVLVDDYVDFAETLAEFIANSNDARCVTFSNPLDALSYISNQNDIDMLITDYEMPRMNGFELAKEVINLKPNIKIIVNSGHDKKSLEIVRSKYSLEDKVEVTAKSNMEYYKNLF